MRAARAAARGIWWLRLWCTSSARQSTGCRAGRRQRTRGRGRSRQGAGTWRHCPALQRWVHLADGKTDTARSHAPWRGLPSGAPGSPARTKSPCRDSWGSAGCTRQQDAVQQQALDAQRSSRQTVPVGPGTGPPSLYVHHAPGMGTNGLPANHISPPVPPAADLRSSRSRSCTGHTRAFAKACHLTSI